MKLIYKIILVFVVIFTILYPILYSANKTGKIGTQTTEKIFVQVLPKVISLKTTVNSSVYCMGSAAEITNTLTNYNYTSVYGTLSTELVSLATQTRLLFESFNDTISAREIKVYKTNYTFNQSDPLRWYRATGNFSYGNGSYFTSDYAEFEVWGGIGYLIASPARIEKTMSPGDYSTQEISMWLDKACNETVADLNATQEIPGNWTSFSPDKVFLSLGGLNQSTVNISVPSNAIEGNYTGEVNIYAGGQKVRIPLIVHVSKNIFDLSVYIPPAKKEVCPKDEVYAVVSISKNRPLGVFDINMTYQLLDFNWKVLDEKKETVSINTTLERIPALYVPSTASPGYYTFLAILNFNTTVIQSSDITRVLSCGLPPTGPSGGGAGYELIIPRPNLTLDLSTYRLWVLAGNKTSFIARVNNTGNVTVRSVRILLEEIPSEWFKIIPGRTDIPRGKAQDYLVLIDVPKDAKAGNYSLNVTAIDDMKSDTKTLLLFVGKDYKQIADMMLGELETFRKRLGEMLALENCLDISEAKKIFEEAEKLIERGMNEYEVGNFEKAVYWFDYAISSFEKIPGKLEVIMKDKTEGLKNMDTIVRILYEGEINHQLMSAKIYIYNKNYAEFCDPVLIIERLRFNGKIIMLAILILIAFICVLIGIVVRMYKRKRELERGILLKRVKERIEKVTS
jgi:hypothetical protein